VRGVESAEDKPHVDSLERSEEKPCAGETLRRQNGRWFSVEGWVLYPWRVRELVAHLNAGALKYREIGEALGTTEPVIRETAHLLRKRGVLQGHRRRPFEAWEEQLLMQQAAAGVDYRVLATCLRRSYAAVKVKLRRMGLHQWRQAGAWTLAEVDLLRRYYDADEVGLRELARRLGRRIDRVRSKAQESGLLRRRARNARIEATKWRQYEVAAFTALFLQWRVAQGLTRHAYNYWLRDRRQLDGWFLNHAVLYVLEVRTSPHNLAAMAEELRDKAAVLLQELALPEPLRLIPVVVGRALPAGPVPADLLFYTFEELGLPRFAGSADWIESTPASTE
jgi:hypothetical protein